MNNQQYQALCSKYPDLTFEGFGVNMEHAEGKTYQEYFAIRRRELEEAFQEFSFCLEWLQTHDIEGKQSAHHLKDKVQFACVPPHTYIPRGAFILADLHSGLTVRKMDRSADAWICDPRTIEVQP